MCKRYSIVELNTAVKPFYADYLFNRDTNVNMIVYLDPDIIVFDKFTYLEDALVGNNIVLTPHIFTPISDKFLPDEKIFLNSGIYNLGFIGMARSEETFRFLKWWKNRLKQYSTFDLCYGLFFDQLWINFAPIFFENVFIARNFGYNVAYWNLHERRITLKNNRYYINETFPLVFFHFSGFSRNNQDMLSIYQNRYTFDNREDITPLFEEYIKRLDINRWEYFSRFKCHYAHKNSLFRLKLMIHTLLRRVLYIFEKSLVRSKK